VNSTGNDKNYTNDGLKQNKNILKYWIHYDSMFPCDMYIKLQTSVSKNNTYNTLFFNSERVILFLN